MRGRARGRRFAAWTRVLLAAWLGASCDSAVIPIPEPQTSFPRDSWAPVRAGLRHLARTDRDSDALLLRPIYEETSFSPFWVTPDSLNEDGRKLMVNLLSAARRGHPRDEYRLLEIGHLFQQAFPESLQPHVHRIAELEWALSKSFLQYARDRLEGRARTLGASSGWHLDRSPADLASWFGRLRDGGLRRTLRQMGRPQSSLEKALAEYRAIERRGGWPRVPEAEEETLELDAVSERVSILRRRLELSGDLEKGTEGRSFDARVERAVRRFQIRHGLQVDGRVGPETLAELNVPVERRIRQLVVNLERRRWIPESLGENFILVNIPEFRLRAFREGRPAVEMAVVVGAPWSPTPAFQDEVEYAVLNPYWNVPESIAVGEIAPRAMSDPGYLSRASFELVDDRGETVPARELELSYLETGRYRLRRRPGPANDLGRIKFMFPNPYRIYLHDTPARGLFEQPKRAFSHGCIRLEDPLALASYLFADRWREEELEQAILSGRQEILRLEDPLPVYLVYFTAWRSEDGLVHFREDLYGHDETLWEGLRELHELSSRGSVPLELLWPSYDTT